MSTCLLKHASFNASINADNVSSSCILASPISLNRFQDAFSLDIPELSHIDNVFGWPFNLNAISGKYYVDLPDVNTIHVVNIGFISSMFIGFLFSTLIYHYMLDEKQRGLSLLKVVMGTILLISSATLPYAAIALSGVQNTAVRFTLCLPFVLFFFRTLEAIFGFVPTGAKSSLGIYRTYFSLPVEMLFDKDSKPIPATRKDVMDGSKNVVAAITFLMLFCSILSPYNYVPFGKTNAGDFNEQIVITDYFNARHLGNCFAIALFFQQGLALGDALFGSAVQLMFGYKVRKSMKNPMMEATSPSDFWGRRWNVLVHSVMKRGVYKPVRTFSSALVASLTVFVASGLFHEWLVHAVLIYNRSDVSETVAAGEILIGSNTAFFVWNFVVIVIERLLSKTNFMKTVGNKLPRLMVTFSIIMTSLPFAHWFGNPYLKGNFFSDYEKCIPVIRKM